MEDKFQRGIDRMTEEKKLGIGVYDSYDREWVLCHDYSTRPYKAYSGIEEELIKLCVKMNIDAGHSENIIKHYFTDHYGVIQYVLDEHGLIAKCREIWCPYAYKDMFGELKVVLKGEDT